MSYRPQIEKVVQFIAKDCEKKRPSLINTIFTAEDLNLAANLQLTPPQMMELMNSLEFIHILRRTEKVSPAGYYYNVAEGVYTTLRKNGADARFVAQLKAPEEGFCILAPQKKVFRQSCAGRKCPFFLAHEKCCVLGKFFIK